MFDLADAIQVMRWYREFQPNAPDEFYIFLALQTVPPGDPFPQEHWGKKTRAFVVCHNGPIADAEKAMKTVRMALPKPLIDWAQPMPYPVLQSLFDPLLPKGLRWYWKGDFVNTLPDTAIDAHVAHIAKAPTSLCGMHFYPIDGAVHRQRRDATVWSHRDTKWSIIMPQQPKHGEHGALTCRRRDPVLLHISGHGRNEEKQNKAPAPSRHESYA
jgi:hypothetical protein